MTGPIRRLENFDAWLEKRVRRPHVMIGLASSGIIIFLFWAISYFSRVLHGKYNPLAQTISRLELGPGGSVEKAGLFAAGTLILAFTACLYSYVRPPKKRTFIIGTFFMIVMGTSAQTIAFIPPVSDQTPGIYHSLLAGLAFGPFPLVCFLQAPQYHYEKWRSVFIYTIVAGILGVGFIVDWALLPENYSGLGERLIILNGMIWFGVMGSYIIYHVLTRGFKPSDKAG